MRKLLCLGLGTLFLCTLSAYADVLVPATSPDANFIVTLDTTTGNFTFSIPSSAEGLFVLDNASNPVGTVIAANFNASSVLTLNIGFSEAVAVSFPGNFSGASISGNDLSVPATGTALSSVTDAGLLQLVGSSDFTFTLAGEGQNSLIFDFTGAQLGVPEPGVAYTVCFGLFAFSLLQLRKRSH